MRDATFVEKLRQLVRSLEFPIANDEDFYAAHRTEIIEKLVRFASSPEFSSLVYRVSANDVFRYIVLTLRDVPQSYWDYEIRINVFDAEFKMTYVDYRRRIICNPTFDTVDAIFAHLAPLKPMIVGSIDELRRGEP